MSNGEERSVMYWVMTMAGIVVLVLGFVGISPMLMLFTNTIGYTLMVMGTIIIVMGSIIKITSKQMTTLMMVLMIVLFLIIGLNIYLILGLTMDVIPLPEAMKTSVAYILFASGILAFIPIVIPQKDVKKKKR